MKKLFSTAVALTALTVSVFALAAQSAVPAKAPVKNQAELAFGTDLMIAPVSNTRLKVWNRGRGAVGEFAVRVSPGYVGDACHWTVPAKFVTISGLARGEVKILDIPASDIPREAMVDVFNQIKETGIPGLVASTFGTSSAAASGEYNNWATVSGANIVC